MKSKVFVAVFGLLAIVGFAFADELVVRVHAVSAEGIGKQIGKVTAVDTKWGLLLTPELSDLPPGLHGFHVHENASCEAAQKDGKMTAAHSAGGHYDPEKTGKHEGPYAAGHPGDLPPLYADADGKSTLPVLAPRLKVSDLRGHALVIHGGGDNLSEQPQPLGGGGPRIACGVVK